MPADDLREVLQHVMRTPLPWRAPTLTRCGREIAELADDRVITFDEAKAKVKRLGQQRAAMFLCMTCSTRGWPEWEQDPVSRMAHECTNVFSSRTGDANRLQIERELRAVAILIAGHRDEFDSLVQAQADGTLRTISDLRAERAARR